MDIDAGSRSPVNKTSAAVPDTKYAPDTKYGPASSPATQSALVSSVAAAGPTVVPEQKGREPPTLQSRPSGPLARPIAVTQADLLAAQASALDVERAAAIKQHQAGRFLATTATPAIKRTASEALRPPSLNRQVTRSVLAHSGVSANKPLAQPASSLVASPQPLGQQAGTSQISDQEVSRQQAKPLVNTSSQPSLSVTDWGHSSNNAEEHKSLKWLATMRAHLESGRPVGAQDGPPSAARARFGGRDTVMVDAQTRSAPAQPSGSASDGDADSDTESRRSALGSSAELVEVLRAIADISAFNAECLSKLSGVPMPDFDVGAEGDQ